MVLGDWDEIVTQMFPEAESVSVESDPAVKDAKSKIDLEEIIPLKLLKTTASEYIEKRVIDYALDVESGNKVKAAKMLNISYKALFYKMKNLGLR